MRRRRWSLRGWPENGCSAEECVGTGRPSLGDASLIAS